MMTPKQREQAYARHRKWRRKNPERFLEIQRKSAAKVRAWLDDFKAQSKCLLCGEKHPACLDFHHRDPATKERTISDAVRDFGVKRLRKEMSKCDVICRNCHAKLHWGKRYEQA